MKNCTCKIDNLDDINQFLKIYNLPKFMHGEVNYLSGPIGIK